MAFICQGHLKVFLWRMYRSEGRSHKPDLPTLLLLRKLFLSYAFELFFFFFFSTFRELWTNLQYGIFQILSVHNALREKCNIMISSVFKGVIMPLYEAVIEC